MGPAEALGGPEQDGFCDPRRIGVHVAVPEADDRPAFAFEVGELVRVSGIPGMLSAIDLDNQPGFTTGEVGDGGADDELSRERGAVARQDTPQVRSCLVALERSARALAVSTSGTRFIA